MDNPISKGEFYWVRNYALAIVLITSIPYFIGFSMQGEDWRFTGFVFGVEDGNSYIAKMMSGSFGSWLFRSPYTSYPQKGTIFFIPYILLGKLASSPGLHEQLVALYHLFRMIAVMLMIYSNYHFIAIFVSRTYWRRIGLVLATVGGGLGWLLPLFGKESWLGSIPLEFYSPESFGFLSLFGLPHLAMARALLLWGFVEYISLSERKSVGSYSLENGKPILSFIKENLLGLLWFLLSLFQPMYVVIGWIVIAIHLTLIFLIENKFNTLKLSLLLKETRRILFSFVISSPLVIYTFIVSLFDPYGISWLKQNVLLSPHPLHYLLAYGLMLPFSILGGYLSLKEPSRRCLLLLGWFAIFPFLVYAPLNVQRRFAEGIWVVCVVLAIKGLSHFTCEKFLSHKIFTTLMFVLSLLSTFLLWVGSISSSLQPSPPIYRNANEVRAFEYFQNRTIKDKVVLASHSTSNALVAWAPVKVIVGHGPESKDLSILMEQIEGFFGQKMSNVDRVNFLKGEKIDYVFWGPYERRLGEWNPNTAPFLIKVYESEGFEIFKFLNFSSN